MDGIQAMKLIKSDPRTRDVPVIMCTGQDESDFRDLAVANGAVGVLTKPPVLEDLDKLLSEAAVPEEAESTAPAATGTELHEILERITRIERRVPAAEHIDRRIAEVSESVRDLLRKMEEELEARLASIADELSSPGVDAAAIAEQAAQRAGEQVARRFGQLESRIKELETALEAALGASAEPLDPEAVAREAAAKLESSLAERLAPLERKLGEMDANLSAEIETLVQRTVSQVPAPPAVLSDTELERVRAVAEATAQDAARQAIEAQEPRPAEAISRELEESLRALSEEIARETARATSQSEAQRVVAEHLEDGSGSEGGDDRRLAAMEKELQALRAAGEGLRRQVRLAMAVAGAAVAAAVALPFVL
jgi:CheY-like chemotaxis protein